MPLSVMRSKQAQKIISSLPSSPDELLMKLAELLQAIVVLLPVWWAAFLCFVNGGEPIKKRPSPFDIYRKQKPKPVQVPKTVAPGMPSPEFVDRLSKLSRQLSFNPFFGLAEGVPEEVTDVYRKASGRSATSGPAAAPTAAQVAPPQQTTPAPEPAKRAPAPEATPEQAKGPTPQRQTSTQQRRRQRLKEYAKKAQPKEEEESPDKENEGPGGDIDRILRTAKKSRNTQQYDLLGLPVNATPRDVQRAYYNLSARIHPDKNPNNPKAKIAMQILNDARQELRSRLEVEEMEAHRAQAAEDISNMMRQPVF